MVGINKVSLNDLLKQGLANYDQGAKSGLWSPLVWPTS